MKRNCGFNNLLLVFLGSISNLICSSYRILDYKGIIVIKEININHVKKKSNLLTNLCRWL